MKDRKPLNLDHLLTCGVDELIAAVLPMSAKDCELYMRAILDRVGGPTFEQYLIRLMARMIPSDGSGPPTKADDYYFAVRGLFPHVTENDDILGRLAFFAMRMCQLRMTKSKLMTKH
jgi:hypothetical protein